MWRWCKECGRQEGRKVSSELVTRVSSWTQSWWGHIKILLWRGGWCVYARTSNLVGWRLPSGALIPHLQTTLNNWVLEKSPKVDKQRDNEGAWEPTVPAAAEIPGRMKESGVGEGIGEGKTHGKWPLCEFCWHGRHQSQFPSSDGLEILNFYLPII